MNQRERMLTIAVVGCLVLGVGMYAARKLAAVYTVRTARVESLTRDLERQRAIVRQGTNAKSAMTVYEERSLPSEKVMASSRYRAWLHEWVTECGIQEHEVSEVGTQVLKDIYEQHTFSVTCSGDLYELTRLLYEFYRADHLHRIKSMTARRLKDKQIALTFMIEALSLPGASDDKDLNFGAGKPSGRLELASLEEYIRLLVHRNPYSPANKKPQFASRSTQEAFVGRSASLEVSARDPENHGIRYRLEGDLPGGARIDSRSGTIRWTPPELGEFLVTVVAEDDGVPSKSDRQELRIVVRDPPPEAEPPRRPSFNVAKYTFLTGVVAINGRPQAWLNNRPEGRMVKVFEGDRFEVGGFTGRIIQIGDRHVTIDTEEGILTVRNGEALAEGTMTPRAASRED